MKINPNNNINYNKFEIKAEEKQQNKTSASKTVQQNAEKITGSYNVAFFGLFGKKKDKVKEPLPVDANFITGKIPLVPNMKYAVSDDAVFEMGIYTLNLSSKEVKPLIEGLGNGESIIFGRKQTNPENKMDMTVSSKHLKIEKDKNGQLLATDLDSLNGTNIMPNTIIPDTLDYSFKLEAGKNYKLSEKSIIDMGSTRVYLSELKDVLEPLQHGQSIILGRGKGANIIYQESDVSRNHLKITKYNDSLFVKDLNSTNGSKFVGIEKHYQNDYSAITSKMALPKGIPTRVPNDSQLYLGSDLTIDMRNKNILNELEEKGRITIGRSYECDFVVPEFYNQVSKKHLILEKDGNDIIATEMGSLNGTSVIPKNEIKPFYGSLDSLSLNQGNVGDCYLLSAVYALSRNPRGQNIIRNMVSVADDGSYIVQFYNEKPIAVKPDELDGQTNDKGQTKRSVSGDLGIKAIERAYGKMLKAEAERRRLINFHPDEMTMFDRIDDGGYVDIALERISGIESKTYSSKDRNLYSAFSNIANTGIRNHIVTCTTPNKGKYSDYTDPQYRFISGHAYAIKDINARNKTISIVNPHNTKLTYDISWNEFAQYFDYMYDAMA